MGGITSGVGIFSGIDTRSLIDQLIAASSRPKILAERRLVQLQSQQAAYLDLNSQLSGLRSAASAFRTESTFQSKRAASSAEDVLTATATSRALPGNYTFLVDRLVSTQQLLSRGFADRNTSALGLDKVSFEPAEARLDRDTALADLNGGEGIRRGRIIITDSDGASTEVNLSKAVTVNDVLNRINSAGGVNVTASVKDGAFRLEGAVSVTSAPGFETAASLGLDSASAVQDGDTLRGAMVYGMHDEMSLRSLNNGTGVDVGRTVGTGRFDFRITITEPGEDPVDVLVNIGPIYEDDDEDGFRTVEGAVSTVGGVIERINAAIAARGITGVTASIDDKNGRINIAGELGTSFTVSENSSTTASTAADLGLLGSATTTLNGSRILADMNTTLVRGLNGGGGIGGDGVLSFTARSGGPAFEVDVSSATTFREVVDLINGSADNGGRIRATLNSAGNGLKITDTSGGSGALIIRGTDGDSTAESLGIDTGADGVNRATVEGSSLQLQYVSRSTLLSSLRGGRGIGEGSFRITDSTGDQRVIRIDENDRTLGDVIAKINSGGGSNVRARINANGDGLELYEDADPHGPVAIRVEDEGGTVARNLNIRGTASGTGEDNVINGSFERTIEFDPTDTLDDVVRNINRAGVGVSVGVINDGSPSNPYRLSITSNATGRDGRFILDTFGFNLGLETIEQGEDALVFFGATDPARGILLTNSTNSFDSVITGVTLDLHRTSEEPVTLSVSSDRSAIESKVNEFVNAFNSVIDRIDRQSRYVEETQERGPLLGDGTTLNLRTAMFTAVSQRNSGFSATFDTLAEVGVTVGSGGKLSFDRERFREALEQDPEAVEALFTRRTIDSNRGETEFDDGIIVRDPGANETFSELGVIAQLEELARSYVTSIDGVLTRRNETIDSQIRLQHSRIETIDRRLQSQREILERQFVAMERAIANLQTQGSALNSLAMMG